MSKVVFLSIPAYGHINPTLPVVQELISRGEDVTYYAMEEFRPQLEALGAAFKSYGTLTDDIDFAHVSENLIELAALLMAKTRTYLPTALDELRALQPDYIIHDSMCVWGKYLVRILDRPGIASVPTFAFTHESTGASNRFIFSLARMLIRSIPALVRYYRIAGALRRTYGIRHEGLPDVFANREPLNIVFTSREFQPEGNRFGESYRFVGPSIAPRHDAAAHVSAEQFDGRPLIYISLGSLISQQFDFYRTCFAAFGDDKYQVVLSAGRQTDLAALGEVPDNFIVRNFVSQLEVLQSTALFVTHGGMNSTHEGMVHGVPLLVIPQMAEQSFVADRVVSVGAGLRLDRKKLTPAALRAAADRVLADPAFRENSQRIGQTLKAAGGYARAVDEIFAFKAAHGIA